jgi:hypothetical protein
MLGTTGGRRYEMRQVPKRFGLLDLPPKLRRHILQPLKALPQGVLNGLWRAA